MKFSITGQYIGDLLVQVTTYLRWLHGMVWLHILLNNKS